MIAKQQAKREQTHPVCLHAVEKYEKEEIANTQNDYETTSKNEEIKRKQSCSVSCGKVFKFEENKFKIVQNNFLEIIIKKISWKTHKSQWSLHETYETY